MPLCPQITNTPITVTQTADFTVSSVLPVVAATTEQLDDVVVQLDGKTKAYYQTTAPTGDLNEGDIWFDTDDGNKQYYYNGTAWVSVQDTAIAAAQAAATAAQTTANGKNKIYRQGTSPGTTGNAIGDTWFNTSSDNAISRWDGSSWVATSLGNGALASISASKITAGTIDASVITVSNLDAGNITTGTLAAARIAAASITGTKIAAGTITASNIAAATITATEIATGTITASQIAASTITTDKLVAGTLTGYTVQTSAGGSGSNAVKLVGLTNSLSFMKDGSYVGHLLNLSSSGILMHLGATASTTAGSSYPYQYLSSETLFMASNSTTSISLGTTIGYTASLHDFYGNLTTNGSSTITAAGELIANQAVSVSVSAATNCYITSTGQIRKTSNTSSLRFKENITDISNVPELDPKALLKLPVRAFSYVDKHLPATDDRYGQMLPGFIAEEVDAIYPIAVDYDKGDIQTWNSFWIVPSMLSLIQDLYKEIDQLKGE